MEFVPGIENTMLIYCIKHKLYQTTYIYRNSIDYNNLTLQNNHSLYSDCYQGIEYPRNVNGELDGNLYPYSQI